MDNIEEISREELAEILAIGKAKHYEETIGLEHLIEEYIVTGEIKLDNNFPDKNRCNTRS